MTIKTLLLGSAAAVAVVGGAQAADLSVAEPVEYVKVCDYFGTGYWYIPGTDTCIKISGWVQETAAFQADRWVGSHSSSWNFYSDVQMDVDVKSETEYGPLEGLISFGGGTYGSGYNASSGWYGRGYNYTLGDDGAFVSLGGFKAGAYQLAAWNPVYAVTDNHGPVNAEIYGTFGYQLLDTVQLSWNSGGISASVAVSDPTGTGFYAASDSAPLVTGNVGWGGKDMQVMLSGGFIGMQGYLSPYTAWGVDALVRFNLGKDDNLELNAAYGGNGFISNWWYYNDTANNGYSALIGWQHNLSKSLSLGLSGSLGHESSTPSGTPLAYALDADLVWSPVTNFSVIGSVDYTKDSYNGNDGSWAASISVKRSW